MKASLIRVLGTLAAGVVAVLAAPASAQLSTTANGPYYATPSWDQKLTNNRFVILANWNSRVVLDRETGLVWERLPDSAPRIWLFAQMWCNGNDVGGRGGWRLPVVQELASLLDTTVADPALPAGHPFTVQSAGYWTATSSALDAASAWVVDFGGDGSVDFVEKSGSHYVWCVRGGQGPDAQ